MIITNCAELMKTNGSIKSIENLTFSRLHAIFKKSCVCPLIHSFCFLKTILRLLFHFLTAVCIERRFRKQHFCEILTVYRSTIRTLQNLLENIKFVENNIVYFGIKIVNLSLAAKKKKKKLFFYHRRINDVLKKLLHFCL